MKVINDISRVLLLFILFMLGNHFVPGQDYDQNRKIDLGFDTLSFADILKIQYDSPLPSPNYDSPLGVKFMPVNYFVIRQDYDQNRKMDLGLDTLSFEEISKIQYDSPSLPPKSDYPSGIKFDSVQIELFHNGKRFAIVPDDLKQEIDDSQISSTKFIIEKLNDNRILLRILKFMEFK